MNWVHLHLALNHVPVLGTFFVGLLLVAALIRNSDELKRCSLIGFVALALVSIPIKFTGDFANEKLAGASWLAEDRVTVHEQAADQATTGMFLLGLAAAFALWQSRGSRPIAQATLWTVLLLSLVTFLLMIRTANLGGEIRHEEIRQSGVSPACENLHLAWQAGCTPLKMVGNLGLPELEREAQGARREAQAHGVIGFLSVPL